MYLLLSFRATLDPEGKRLVLFWDGVPEPGLGYWLWNQRRAEDGPRSLFSLQLKPPSLAIPRSLSVDWERSEGPPEAGQAGKRRAPHRGRGPSCGAHKQMKVVPGGQQAQFAWSAGGNWWCMSWGRASTTQPSDLAKNQIKTSINLWTNFLQDERGFGAQNFLWGFLYECKRSLGFNKKLITKHSFPGQVTWYLWAYFFTCKMRVLV